MPKVQGSRRQSRNWLRPNLQMCIFSSRGIKAFKATPALRNLASQISGVHAETIRAYAAQLVCGG